MRLNNIASMIILASILAGCGLLGPDYIKPNTNNMANWYNRDNLSKIESTNLTNVAWWKKFNDPRLNTLVESALVNNNNIQISIGNIIAAQGQLQQIQMGWVPSVSLSGTQKNTSAIGANGANNGFGNNAFVPTGNSYNLGFVPSYSLNIFQQIKQQQSAEANLAAMQAAKDASRLTVIGQTVASYFTLMSLDYQLELQEQLVIDLKQLLDLSVGQYNLGLISLLTLQQYQLDYQNGLAQVPLIRADIASTQNALRLLLNENPGRVKRGMAFMKLNGDSMVPINMPSQVLRNRPDVVNAEQNLIMSNANIGVATSTFFPTINLTGGLGSTSSALGGLFGPGTNFWQEQINATMPFLSLSTYGQIKQAKGQYYAAYFQYIQTVRNAFTSVDSDLVSHEQNTLSLQAQISSYDDVFRAYSLSKLNYQYGLISLPQLLSYKITADKSALLVQASKLNQLNTIVTLYQDLGAGYNVKNNMLPKKFGDSHDS